MALSKVTTLLVNSFSVLVFLGCLRTSQFDHVARTGCGFGVGMRGEGCWKVVRVCLECH